MAEPRALLADRYRLVRQVGSGGMGIVWEARDERLERPVAVKQLRPQVGLSPEEAELAKNRAMREARITARLHHRNAVPVFDVVEHEGQPCLIMQFLPSVPLSKEIREGGPLSAPEAARVGAQVASALAAAHQLGIVHRDVKPGNILITDDGTALISDFGISHALGDATLTSTGLVHGTPAYLAPEVARGADSGFASDVFSLGATLYAAVEGAPPFGTDSNSIALLYKVASGEFPPPQRAGALAPVLMQMLRSDPAARPAMKEVASRLAAIEAGDAGAATLPLPAAGPAPTPDPQGSTTAIRPGRTDAPPTYVAATQPAAAGAPLAAAPASPAGATVVAPPSSLPPSAPGPVDPGRPARRRRGAWAAALALLVGLVVLGAAAFTGQLGGGTGTAAGPATVATSAPPASAEPSDDETAPADPAPSSADASSEEPSPSESPSETRSPSPSPSPTTTSGEPSAKELEDVIKRYYALVPDDTDEAWPLLTARYQRNPSGGKNAYERFWGEVDSVSVSKVEADPPSKVEATVTYRRGDAVAVERTSYRLVRDDGVLKIDSSSVVSSS